MYKSERERERGKNNNVGITNDCKRTKNKGTEQKKDSAKKQHILQHI